MKYRLLLFTILTTVACQAQQSLKDALFSGRLKNDSGSVLRKGEDLTAKIDTATRVKPAEQVVVAKTTATVANNNNSPAINNNTVTQGATSPNITSPASATRPEAKDNNTTWKTYMDELIVTLKDEVLSSNKVKAGTYYILVNYEIGTDGQITVGNIASTPGNSFLQDQIKQRITLTAPQMSIELNQYGQPRKATKRYNFTLTKAN